MKKLLAILLALTIAFSFAACTNTEEESSVPESSESQIESESSEEESESVEESEEESAEESSEEESTSEDAPAAEGDTLGDTLCNDFETRVKADASLTAQAIADALLTNPAIKFNGASMPVEPGVLMGFGETEITGFSEGVMFSPMIGSIPFVGYIFILEDGTDVTAFKNTLTENCDPRWNICTEAEQTVCASVDNTVFFVMCPTSIEE